jgi:hypothetical protein
MSPPERPVAGTPVACGALGRFDSATVGRIASALEVELTEIHRDDRSLVLLDRPPVPWEGGRERGLAWGERVATSAAGAGDWHEAAAAGALGLVVGPVRTAIHSSASGFAPLYWLRDGEALYFATAADALARGTSATLSVDWESVASVIAIGYPPGDGTLFAEIKRLDPLALLEQRPDSSPEVTGGDLGWAEVEPNGSGDAAEDIAAGLRQEVAALDRSDPIHCALSGGWDSRLLLCLLAERELDLSAWTVDMDTGHERESELAAPVADGLGVPHTVIETSRRDFVADFEDTARRVEYLTSIRYNVFLTRLARSMPIGVAVDGSGAGFVKGYRNLVPLGADYEWSRGASGVFDYYAPPAAGDALLRAEAWRAIRGTAQREFAAEADRFAGHPAAATLGIYWTRTRRRTSPAPLAIFGARNQIAMPFLNDAVIRASLRIPQEEKAEGRLFRRVFEVVNPEIGALPSTNDGVSRGPRATSRPTRSPAARRLYSSLLAASPLRPWFSDDLRAALERGKLGKRVQRAGFLERVQLVCCLTLWLDRYRDRLGDFDPTDLLGPPARGL